MIYRGFTPINWDDESGVESNHGIVLSTFVSVYTVIALPASSKNAQNKVE